MSDERGTTLCSWAFDEYEQHERSRGWYVYAGIAAALLLLYAFRSRNFLFAVIVVMVAMILYLRHTRSPSRMTCTLTERGVILEEHFISYEDLRNFWVVDDAGPWGTLYVHHRGVRPRLVIPIRDQEADAVRAILRKYLPEEKDADEPASDVFARILKL